MISPERKNMYEPSEIIVEEVNSYLPAMIARGETRKALDGGLELVISTEQPSPVLMELTSSVGEEEKKSLNGQRIFIALAQ